MSLLMVSKLPYPHRHMAAKRRFRGLSQFPAFIFAHCCRLQCLSRGQSDVNFYVYDIFGDDILFIYFNLLERHKSLKKWTLVLLLVHLIKRISSG